VLSAVGFGSDVGILRSSAWNNPEPEVALIVDSRGAVAGATLANDVNLRDIEGRSALLLGRAKDNNASCAIGPFVRLFDDAFGMDDVRRARVRLEVTGVDGFGLEDWSDMRLISRDPLDLVSQLMGEHHQYPDGAVLMLGTLFAPTADRHEPGLGFHHEPGDVVRISSPALGALVNTVQHSEACAPWTFGIGALYQNLASRGLLVGAEEVR
jgi:fumarylacetoacetate (FAA) hydrolase family protein